MFKQYVDFNARCTQAIAGFKPCIRVENDKVVFAKPVVVNKPKCAVASAVYFGYVLLFTKQAYDLMSLYQALKAADSATPRTPQAREEAESLWIQTARYPATHEHSLALRALTPEEREEVNALLIKAGLA